MKTGFKNPIEGKEGKEKKSPWNFDCPPYDERSSCYVNAGTHHGVGYKQPVGTKMYSGKSSVPMGRPNTMEVSKVLSKNLPVNIEE